MTRAICIPFHRYHPHVGDRYRVYFEYFKKSLELWGGESNRFYLIDSDWGFSESDFGKDYPLGGLGIRLIEKSANGSHWDNLRKAAKEITEDHVLFMDQDMLIWDAEIIENWFNQAQEVDVLTAFDSSGGMVDKIQARYPMMKTNSRARMGTYTFILNRKALALMSHTELAPIRYKPGVYIKELDRVAKKGDWLDSFGYLTLRYLYNNFEFGRIHDNRASIHLVDGKVVEEKGELINGYYHIRNGNLPILMLDQDNDEYRDQFEHLLEITPKQEILRILAWLVWIGIGEESLTEALRILSIDRPTWHNYYKEFQTFHSL